MEQHRQVGEICVTMYGNGGASPWVTFMGPTFEAGCISLDNRAEVEQMVTVLQEFLANWSDA